MAGNCPEKMKISRGKVCVVYYLSRNGQLEHPHFMEVTLSSPNGLFLRDVIGRLNVLRGTGMAAMYSWSCKRSYKNGFVWHDLSDDDFIFPVNGHEYTLKGSEKSKMAGDWSERRRRNHSCGGAIDFNITEYSVYKAEASSTNAAADASTQTDERRRKVPEIVEEEKSNTEQSDKIANGDEIEIEITPPPSDSSSETLEALMKSDGVRPSSAIEESTAEEPQSEKTEKSSLIFKFMSCGPRQRGLGNLISRMTRGAAAARGGGGTMKTEVPALKRSISCHANGRNLV